MDRFVEQFDDHGLTLVWASAQNIDRLVTLYKACRRAGKLLIIDVYTALILDAARPARVPQAGWTGIRVFLPAAHRRRVVQDKRFDLVNRFRPYRIFPEEIACRAGECVLLFRPSMTSDLDAIGGLPVGRMIHSLWPGYLEEGRHQRLVDWLDKRGVGVVHCHTSGHASPADLLRLRRAFPDATAIPLHTSAPAIAASLFDQPVRLLSDGEWYELGSE